MCGTHTHVHARTGTRVHSGCDTWHRFTTNHEILLGRRLGSVLQGWSNRLLIPLNTRDIMAANRCCVGLQRSTSWASQTSVIIWPLAWHFTEGTFEDIVGYSREGRVASFLKGEIKQMKELPERRHRKTLLLSKKNLSFVNSEESWFLFNQLVNEVDDYLSTRGPMY